MAEQYDLLFKFIVIGMQHSASTRTYAAGDAAVGKSCLLHRFIDNKCAPRLQSAPLSLIVSVKSNEAHTIGVEFGSKVVDVANKRVKLQVRQAYLPEPP